MTEKSEISFMVGAPNQLLVNPRLSEAEKKVFVELKVEFEKQFGDTNYFLVPSSGSSKAADQSVKLIALHLESVLNSAKRVNVFLKAKKEDRWGLFLPKFHVAGLGVLARAFLAGSAVKVFDFDILNFEKTLSSNEINFISLVPAQIFDLVRAKMTAPRCLKKVFVGGGFLDEGLKNDIHSLGWSVIETFGMTETSSMVAVREFGQQRFSLLPGVSAKIEEDLLSLSCDSLLSAVIQKKGSGISVLKFDRNGWFQTEDLAGLFETESGSSIEIYGRKTDFVKILGEGVSLSELRSKLQEIGLSLGLDPRKFALVEIEHARSGYELILVVEEEIKAAGQQDLLASFNAQCRPYERIAGVVVLRQIPRTDLGKLKTAELKHIIKAQR